MENCIRHDGRDVISVLNQRIHSGEVKESNFQWQKSNAADNILQSESIPELIS